MQSAADPSAACCGACAAEADAPTVAVAVAAPGPIALATGRPRPRRDVDRTIAGLSLGLAALFVLAGMLVAVVGRLTGAGSWLPLHLVLAGAAGTAIAGVLPFFTAALAVAPPVDPRARLMAIGLIVVGAVLVVAAMGTGATSMATVGGSVYLLGLVTVGVVAFRPLRGALGPRRRVIESAYLGALVAVVVGVTLATTMLAGWAPVVERWAMLKPAHVWLNLVGSLSVIIVATLTHLAPTVEGTRMRPRTAARVALAGLGLGAAAVALGYALGLDLLARAGAAIALGGAVAVPLHALAVRSTDDPWTTDRAWHRFATWSLRAGSGWFLAGMVVMGGRVIWLGADPLAWSVGSVAIPFVIGWVLQVLVGSWSHLIPALGPGDPAARATRRRLLGQGATVRFGGLNVGILLAWIGVAVDAPMLLGVGALAIGLALAGGVGLAATAAHGRPRAVATY
ncbi:MAG: hypothetical protein ACAH65_12185 [Chloroflexota bacterium]